MASVDWAHILAVFQTIMVQNSTLLGALFVALISIGIYLTPCPIDAVV